MVDTNVWRANAGHASHIGEGSRQAVRDYVEAFRQSNSILVVDDSGHIFCEYTKRPYSYQDPTRDLFDLLLSSNRVDRVQVKFQDGIAILPRALDEIVTDDDDKKFVAVADKHPENPPIVNATDRNRGWAMWENQLRGYGIDVIQLCPSEP